MLPRELVYEGEFGPEVVLFLPFVRWLAARGELKRRTVSTYEGMAPFYAGLDIGRLVERSAARRWLHPEDRPYWLPVKNEHDFDRRRPSARMDFGDLRRQFLPIPLGRRVEKFISDSPTLIIHNKYASEWDRSPINYIDTNSLAAIIEMAERAGLNVLYIRHGMRDKVVGYSDDHNENMSLDDAKVISGRLGTLEFHEALAMAQEDMGGMNLNAFKCGVLSRSHKYISVQGGGSALMAQFKGAGMAILHRAGSEEHWAYDPGYYSFAASPAPKLMVVRDDDELLQAAQALIHSEIDGGCVLPRPQDATVWSTFAPGRLRARRAPELDVWTYPRGGLWNKARRRLRRLIAS